MRASTIDGSVIQLAPDRRPVVIRLDERPVEVEDEGTHPGQKASLEELVAREARQRRHHGLSGVGAADPRHRRGNRSERFLDSADATLGAPDEERARADEPERIEAEVLAQRRVEAVPARPLAGPR